MFLAHSFRLRDPWQCEADDAGNLRWTRVFHRPTGLEPDDQLVLVISGLPATAQVTVNGHAFACPTDIPPGATGVPPAPDPGTSMPPRPTPSPFQADVTTILTESNRIELLVPPAARGLAPPPSSLQPTASFPYDARLAILGRS